MAQTRLAYLDNLRFLVIILVITMHSAVTYSGFGSWYYVEGAPEKLNVFEMVIFGFLQSFLQAWFMGILFFISAFFAAKSLSKYGSLKFFKERLFRLGLPLLIYMLFIDPSISYFILGQQSDNPIWHDYINYLLSLDWLSSSGPLWFALALLIFCTFYIVIRKFIPKQKTISVIQTKNIIVVIALTGIAAFLIRLVFPIGSAVLNLQFSYFASYITLFVFGIMAGENDLLDSISERENIKWMILSLVIGIPLWGIIMVFGGTLEGNFNFNGGFNWQSFAFALWESFTAIGFSIGLTAFFREKLNSGNAFSGLLTENAFGMYFFHAPILIAVSLLLKNWAAGALIKFITVMILAAIGSFAFSLAIRKIKPAGILLK